MQLIVPGSLIAIFCFTGLACHPRLAEEYVRMQPSTSGHTWRMTMSHPGNYLLWR